MKLQQQLKLWEIPYKLNLIELLALSVSAGVSTFGLYTILKPLITEEYRLALILATFIGFFMLIDKLRRGALGAFFNSLLTQLVESYMNGTFQLKGGKEVNITPTKTKWFAGILGGVFSLVIFGSDIFGGYSIYEVGKKNLVSYEISTNQSYQKEVQDEQTGKKAAEEYNANIIAWNNARAKQLEVWRADEKANRKAYDSEKRTAYAECDRKWSLKRSFFTKNETCKRTWDNAHHYIAIAKPAELMKPVLVATSNKEVIGSSIDQVTAEATQWAEPFAKGFFALYVVLSLILNGLVLKSLYLAFTEMERDINSDPSLYKTAYEHHEMIRRAERHGISENKQKEEVETMNVRVKLSEKITDLVIQGEAKKAAIKLRQHQILEKGGYKDIIKHLRNKDVEEADIDEFAEYFNNTETKQPTPKKIEQKEPQHQEAAKDTTQPIGFKVGEGENVIVQPKAPIYKENSYFDDGYDLTVAIWHLFKEGKVEAGMELPSNPEFLKLYNQSPYKRSELKLNEISAKVRKPLKELELIKERKGFKDVALYNLDEVLAEMGLLTYGAEITSQQV